MPSNTQKMELRQGQTLAMTPQMQMSLKILQLSNLELAEFIEKELEQNPLLEKGEPQQETDEERVEKSETTTDTEEISDVINNNSSVENSSMDADYDNVWSNDDKSFDSYDTSNKDSNFENSSGIYIEQRGTSNDFRNSDNYYEQVISKEKTLQEHILDQINIDINDNHQKIIAIHLLDAMDENGYIDPDFSTISELLECEISVIEDVLKILQKFDPPGIFARSLSECLMLQLKDRNHCDPAIEKLIENLDMVADGNYKRLMKICEVDEDDIIDMIKETKTLNPKPGSDFESERSQIIQADVFLKRNPDRKWAIELNNETLPKVLINNKYYSEIKGKAKEDNEKKYISEQMNTANWLIRSLHQRAETILKVATEIVSQQNDFFNKGIHHLKPMTLHNVAEKLDIHESTVGRVTSNKYISTPRGIYELKFFFSSALHSSSEGEEDYSSKSVKHMIKELIDNEEQLSVLSDEKLSEILKEKGIDVARRTVAKYRESMRIPTSSRRKRQKNLKA